MKKNKINSLFISMLLMSALFMGCDCGGKQEEKKKELVAQEKAILKDFAQVLKLPSKEIQNMERDLNRFKAQATVEEARQMVEGFEAVENILTGIDKSNNLAELEQNIKKLLDEKLDKTEASSSGQLETISIFDKVTDDLVKETTQKIPVEHIKKKLLEQINEEIREEMPGFEFKSLSEVSEFFAKSRLLFENAKQQIELKKGKRIPKDKSKNKAD